MSVPRAWPLVGAIACMGLGSAAPAAAQAPQADSIEPRLVIQSGHAKTTTSMAFSPDGQLLLTGSLDASARLWQAATGREIRTFDCSAEHEMVFDVAFTPDGRHALAACADRKVHMFDVRTGADVRQFEAGPSYHIRALAVTPDGQHVLAGGSESAPLFEIATGRRVAQFDGSEEVDQAQFSPDGGRLLTSGSDLGAEAPLRNVRLWNTATHELERTFEAAPTEQGRSLAWAPDGAHFVSGPTESNMEPLDVRRGAPVWERQDVGSITDLAFSPDGGMIVVGMIGEAADSDRLFNTAFTGERTVSLLDAATGRELRPLEGHTTPVHAVTVSPDGKYVAAAAEDGSVLMWARATGWIVSRFVGYGGWVEFARLSPGAESVLTGNEDRTAHVWQTGTGRLTHRRFFGHVPEHGLSARLERWDTILAFTADGRFVRVREGEADRLWDMRTGRLIEAGHAPGVETPPASQDDAHRYRLSFDDGLYEPAILDVAEGREVVLEGQQGQLTSHAFSPDGRYLLAASWDAYLWEIGTGRLVHTLSGGPETGGVEGVEGVAFSPDGSLILTSHGDFSVGIRDAESGSTIHTLRGHTQPVLSMSFSDDRSYVITGSMDGTTRLWDAASGREIAVLHAFSDGTWAVTDRHGRFDTNDLEKIEGVHWIMPDDPLTPLGVEVFMRDYYEPRLLPRLLADDDFAQMGDLASRNRVQPRVALVDVVPSADGVAAVTVEVRSGARHFGRGADSVRIESGAADLRLFRDGQLVAYADGPLGVNGDGIARYDFPDILIPRTGADSITFSAYAFNEDFTDADGAEWIGRVKSTTDYRTVPLPESLEPRKGVAYLINIGVDAYQSPVWNLRFAANDARLLGRELAERLGDSGAYADVVTVPLIADQDPDSSTSAARADIQAVLDLLAGREVSAEARARIPNAERIRAARPEDLVLVSFSGHGYTDPEGVFYMLPSDIGPDAEKEVTRELLSRTVSSDQLTRWLRDVDAGELVLIVDACHSAAAVEGAGFKPGPLGSRGLGQLAYDKGMRVLAASQAEDVALESDLLRQGLLTYALVQDGLEAGKADHEPQDGRITLDEWLRYAPERVPSLYQEVLDGEVETAGRGFGDEEEDALFQRPALFDFRKGQRQVVLEDDRLGRLEQR